MESSIRLGRIRGIAIGIHYSWLVVFVLLTASLALGLFPSLFPGLTTTTYWIIGAISAILLFVAVLLHELAHSFVAQSRGIEVKSITLFIFGGVANLTGEPRSAMDEFLIAIVGPITSLIIGGIFFGILFAMQGANTAIAAIVFYLAYVNVLLAIFNLIPGFPLDGGRVFRSIVWAITGNFRRATNIASGVGQVIGYLFIFGGLYIAFTGNWVSGIWLAFIGWFLNNAAEQSRQAEAFKSAFDGVTVASLMNPHPATASPNMTIEELVEDYVWRQNVRAIPVVESGNFVGLITLTDIRNVPRAQWSTTTVAESMTPASKIVVVPSGASVQDVLQQMANRDINQVPVIDRGQLVGLLSRANIINYLQVRQELGEPATA